MNKKELISAAAAKLRADEKKKPIRIQKHKFYITDSDGNTAEFEIGQRNNQFVYTMNDVATILDTVLTIIVDCIKNGEEVSVRGFGAWKLHKRAARRTKQPGTNEWVDVEARIVPKFFFGEDLRMAARAYELIKDDAENAPKLKSPAYYEEDL